LEDLRGVGSWVGGIVPLFAEGGRGARLDLLLAVWTRSWEELRTGQGWRMIGRRTGKGDTRQ
jgi:hypothetical protein